MLQLILQMPSSKSLLSRAETLAADLELTNLSCLTTGQFKSSICSAQRQEFVDGLCRKPLHGKFLIYTRSDTINASLKLWTDA